MLTAGVSASERQLRYEALRRHALESQSAASGDGLEQGFIERQGLAAWLVRGPEGFTNAADTKDSPTDPLAEALPQRELILALTDLIVGDRWEHHHDQPA